MNGTIGLHDASFAAAICVVPAMRGPAWLRQGWEYFRFCPGPWMATVAVFLIATVGVPVGWGSMYASYVDVFGDE